MISTVESDETDIERNWFSDEEHFHLQGYVNK